MKKMNIWLGLLLCCALLAACAPQSVPDDTSTALPQAPSPAAPASVGGPVSLEGLNAENYPRVDGSTANLPLMAEIYARVCGVTREEAERQVSASKTAYAWQALADGSVDLLLVYEAPEETRASLEAQGVELETTAIGRDGLVFLTNEENAVESLRVQQLRDIYAGRITDWGKVGGPAGPITAFQRNSDSGSQALFLKLVMQGEEPMEAPTELQPGGMGDLMESLAAFDGSSSAIGYSVYYYASEMYAQPNLRFMGVEGVMPSNETIADQSYPLTNDFYVVIRANEPEGSPARILRDWIVSEEGVQVLLDAGYVSAL